MSQIGAGPAPTTEDETEFSDEEMEDDEVDLTQDPGETDAGPIEHQLILLPSTGRVPDHVRQVELSLRLQHADRHLSRLRELIADKSFQYSHVMREAPTTGVITKSRLVVKNLNHEIARHCRIYNHSHSRLLLLTADPHTLQRFRHLTKDDVQASTAVLDPNTPGSTGIRLSWIWRNLQFFDNAPSGGSDDDISDPETLIECKR